MKPIPHLAEYGLSDGFVHNWLVAGPRVLPAGAPPTAHPGPAVEAARLDRGADSLTWRYIRCGEDHLLDLSAAVVAATAPGRLETWAACQLATDSPMTVRAEVFAPGPMDLWLADTQLEPVGSPAAPGSARAYQLSLTAGATPLTLRFERPGGPPRPNALRLRQEGDTSTLPSGLRVLIPVITTLPQDRALYEAALDDLYLDRDVYPGATHIPLHWSRPQPPGLVFTARFQTPEGLIYAEAFDVRPSIQRQIQIPTGLRAGPYQVLLLPDTREFHDEKRLRVSRTVPLWLASRDFAQTPAGDFASRRSEALAFAARQKGNLYGEIAKLALGWWQRLDQHPLHAALETVPSGGADGNLALVGLLGLLFRFSTDPGFPPDLSARIERAARAAPPAPAVDQNDDAYLLAITAQILLAQWFGDPPSARAPIEAAALTRLRGLGRRGFQPWPSSLAAERLVVALVHVLTFSDNQTLCELASVALDKLFFILGVNSYRGTFGAPRAADLTAALLGGRLAPTASLTWLLWGLGALNHHLAGLVSLAYCGDYEMPPVLAAIAADQPRALWSRERHGDLSLTAFKTPDFLLASTQDCAPGQPGAQEQAWQATLGPDAVVFTNHPGNASLLEVHPVNFWRGNAARPRVTQWRETVIAVYQAPAEAGLDFTHAYFPTHAFDEYRLEQGWAFARVGEAYLALTAAAGITLTTTGDHACRELRSPGRANVWLCHLGREAEDRSFDAFQQRVLGSPLTLESASVRWTTPRGDDLSFGWSGPFLVNGAEPPRHDEWHLENAYTRTSLGSEGMEVLYSDQGLRLSFE